MKLSAVEEPRYGLGPGWLVTTLIDRDTYQNYLSAERHGLLDTPLVRAFAESMAGTVPSIIVGPGTIRSGAE